MRFCLRTLTSVMLLVVATACSPTPRAGGPSDVVDEPLPRPVGDRTLVTSMHGTSARDVWAIVGTADAGTALLHFDGARWQAEALPEGDSALRRIFAASPSDVWRVGANGAVAHYDGKAWSFQRLAAARASDTPPFSYYDLVDVMAWPGEVWVFDAGDGYYRLAGDWWERVSLATTGAKHVSSAWGISPADAWAATDAGLARFDGKIWRRAELPPEVKGGFYLLAGTAADDVWLVTREQSLGNELSHVYHGNGQTWTETPLPSRVVVNAVAARSRSEAYVVGKGGAILRWDGTAWTALANPNDALLSQVYAPPDGPPFFAGALGARVLRVGPSGS
jgi:photosystem II stability/assembly factor-like uncharacterized protein